MTTTSEPLPTYTATPGPGASATPGPPQDYGGELPAYTFPTSFNIGGISTDGILVEIPQIKAHLALLHAFASLKVEVESSKDRTLQMPEDRDKRWAWFVGLAAERFDMWCRSLTSKDAQQPLEDVLPPLDVLMVWHSYMLNPRWYAEDGQRMAVCRPLGELGQAFARELHRLPEILDSPPADERVASFMRRVGVPFDAMQSARVLVNKTVFCPRCRTGTVVPYMTSDGKGYLQQGFQVQCWAAPDCIVITKEALCAYKFAENVSRHCEGPEKYLSGTFFTESPRNTQIESEAIVKAFRFLYKKLSTKTSSPSLVSAEMCRKMLDECNYSLSELRGKVSKRKLITRIMSAHSTPMVYSVDLPGAVLRQGSFIQKMKDLGWTGPGYFDAPDDELALQHAIARYHAFLDLLSSSPASFFVPTLDIDLVWHTHQLASSKYASDCMRYIWRFIDHDDKVAAPQLSSAFDLTCRAWQDRFGLPYTHCGCPLPGSTIGQRLSRFISGSKARHLRPSQLVPPAHRHDAIAATHASEHNGVQFVARNRAAYRRERIVHVLYAEKVAKRAKREERELQKQKVDALERERERKEARRRDNRDVWYCGYGAPFLMPVPIYYGAGFYPGCVSANASVVDHGGACGNANGVCGGGACSSGGCGSGGCGAGSSGGGDGGGGGCGGGGCGGGS